MVGERSGMVGDCLGEEWVTVLVIVDDHPVDDE